MKIVYYVEVISSWCYWAEPAWKELRKRFAHDAEFVWKIALMDASGLPTSRQQCEWFYRRSGTMVRSPFLLNAGWFESGVTEYLAPNLVAEAAKDFGAVDDRVRLALAHAALREGARVGQWETAAQIGAAALEGLFNPNELLARARSPEIEARARTSSREFHALGVNQRPTFVFENALGDRAVISGVAAMTPLIAVTEALLADECAQLSYNMHHGNPPAA